MIYLDYNATAPLRPEVIAVMQELQGVPLNASSIHASGRKAKQILEASRKTIAEAINCFANEVIFVGTGSEANNWALSGVGILVSAVEHASVLKYSPHPSLPPQRGKGQSASPTSLAGEIVSSTPSSLTGEGWGGGGIIPVNADGLVELNWLDSRLQSGEVKLVSVMLANNETGVIQPIREIADIVHKHGALLHTDAVQALGKIPLDFSSLGADMMTLSAHKMGGPVGAAVLVVRNDLPITPFIKGGGQELNRRAGTENIPAIAGFAEAVKRMDFEYMQTLRTWLEDAETELLGLAKDARVMGQGATRLPNTLCLSMPDVASETQLIAFDIEKIAVSAGSACSSGRVESSHVLRAMGVEAAVSGSAIRVSGGWNTKENEVKSFVLAWKKLYQRLHKTAA